MKTRNFRARNGVELCNAIDRFFNEHKEFRRVKVTYVDGRYSVGHEAYVEYEMNPKYNFRYFLYDPLKQTYLCQTDAGDLVEFEHPFNDYSDIEANEILNHNDRFFMQPTNKQGGVYATVK